MYVIKFLLVKKHYSSYSDGRKIVDTHRKSVDILRTGVDKAVGVENDIGLAVGGVAGEFVVV